MSASAACVNVHLKSSSLENLSRYALLEWLNDCLQTRYSKVEQLCSGAPYCKMMHLLFPGSVSIKEIKNNTKREIDYVRNFKLLLESFKKVGCVKDIPTDNLIKGKFQDNFEFLQWFKKFFDANYVGPLYDAHRDGKRTRAKKAVPQKPVIHVAPTVQAKCPEPESEIFHSGIESATEDIIHIATELRRKLKERLLIQHKLRFLHSVQRQNYMGLLLKLNTELLESRYACHVKLRDILVICKEDLDINSFRKKILDILKNTWGEVPDENPEDGIISENE